MSLMCCRPTAAAGGQRRTWRPPPAPTQDPGKSFCQRMGIFEFPAAALANARRGGRRPQRSHVARPLPAKRAAI
ncbi:MAG TPA: hypothetical protein VM223_17715 [Planctomycetota bacterium]|nr:hypothetical protein [Planctomycetota bacterium]